MKVIYVDQKEEYLMDHLQYLVDDEIEVVNATREEAVDCAKEFDVVIGAWLPKEFLHKAVKLRYFIIPFAGIPSQDKENLREFPDITIINSHFNKKYVAEHAWALLLASAKKICYTHEKMKKGDWTPRYEHHMGTELEGKCLLILGYGAIGRVVGKIGKAFEMEVIAINRSGGSAPEIDYLGIGDELSDLLARADFIVVTLPLTDDTEGILGHKEFEKMKDGVHVINVGRGPVIDEEAFFKALESGKIGGAALDTWWVYPSDKRARDSTFPSNYLIDRYDNIVFSPHRGSHVKGREKKRIEELADILNDLNKGKERNVIDLDRGY